MAWTVHIADASGVLRPFVQRITQSILAAEDRVGHVIALPDVDVVVQNVPGRVIQELGYVGYAPTGSLVHLSFDADNDHLPDTLGEALERQVAHEANHVMRWRGPGYGRTLGAALMSEGLAGQFTRQLYLNAPEPWEVPAEEDLSFLPEVVSQWEEPYDHVEWFFGGNKRPHWLGYRLGYRLVGRHIDKTGKTAAELTMEPAKAFLPTVAEMAA